MVRTRKEKLLTQCEHIVTDGTCHNFLTIALSIFSERERLRKNDEKVTAKLLGFSVTVLFPRIFTGKLGGNYGMFHQLQGTSIELTTTPN